MDFFVGKKNASKNSGTYPACLHEDVATLFWMHVVVFFFLFF